MFQIFQNKLGILEYTYIFKYIFIALLISILLLALSTLFVYQKPEREKMSVYECGFNPYGDARSKFEVKYYIVGILFIIFDLEVSYIFPWVVGWWNLTWYGICVMYFFLLILIIGFIYELSFGVLDLRLLKFNLINNSIYLYFFVFVIFFFINFLIKFLILF